MMVLPNFLVFFFQVFPCLSLANCEVFDCEVWVWSLRFPMIKLSIDSHFKAQIPQLNSCGLFHLLSASRYRDQPVLDFSFRVDKYPKIFACVVHLNIYRHRRNHPKQPLKIDGVQKPTGSIMFLHFWVIQCWFHPHWSCITSGLTGPGTASVAHWSSDVQEWLGTPSRTCRWTPKGGVIILVSTNLIAGIFGFLELRWSFTFELLWNPYSTQYAARSLMFLNNSWICLWLGKLGIFSEDHGV